MNYKTILITGGAGFIGSNLAVYFKAKYPKIKIIALDNLKRRGSEINLLRLKEKGITFVHGDIRCQEDLNLSAKIDLLIECSAEPSVLAGFGSNPAYVINTNLSGTVNCLELARRDNAGIIFLSTSRIYPYKAVNNIKVKETDLRFSWLDKQQIRGWSKDGINEDFTKDGPKTLYGATKLASELLLEEYVANYGIKAVIDRCGVIAGPYQFGKVDQGVFTFWLLSHYFKKGINYIGFKGKGKQVRDLLHIKDLFALVDLQAVFMNKISGEVYNVGGGAFSSLSLLEATSICEKLTGNRIRIGSDKKNRPGDISIYITDNRKAKRDLGWQPCRKPLEIFEDTLRWIEDNDATLKESLL